MIRQELEYCIKCDEPTGNAGRDDDSLYVNHQGPYCDDCYREQLIDRNEDLEIMREASDSAIRIQQEEIVRLKEERDRLKKEIEYCRSTLKDISIGACDCPDTIEECHSLLAHIQLDASWALCETDKEERQ